MELKNLIDITPEIKKEAFGLLQACKRLKRLEQLVEEQYKDGHFDINAGMIHDKLVIYDRHEYSKDKKNSDLGFFVHRFYSDGKYQLGFIAEKSEEARAFNKAFNEAQKQEAENGEN